MSVLARREKKRTENDTSCHWHNWLTECEQCSPQLCYIVLHLWLATVAILNVFIVVARIVDADDVAVVAEKMKLKMFHWLTIRKRKIQKSPLNANLNRLNALFRLMDGWNLFIYMWAELFFVHYFCMFWVLFWFLRCIFCVSRRSSHTWKEKNVHKFRIAANDTLFSKKLDQFVFRWNEWNAHKHTHIYILYE